MQGEMGLEQSATKLNSIKIQNYHIAQLNYIMQIDNFTPIFESCYILILGFERSM